MRQVLVNFTGKEELITVPENAKLKDLIKEYERVTDKKVNASNLEFNDETYTTFADLEAEVKSERVFGIQKNNVSNTTILPYEEGRVVKIKVSPKTLAAFDTIAKQYKIEFSVIAKAERRNWIYTVTEAYIPEQWNTVATTEYTSKETKVMYNEYGISKDDTRGHLHSHGTFACFPSGTDKVHIKLRAEENLFNVAIIRNNNKDMYGHIIDTEVNIHAQNVPITYYLDYNENQEFINSEYEDIKEFCEKVLIPRYVKELEKDKFYNSQKHKLHIK